MKITKQNLIFLFMVLMLFILAGCSGVTPNVAIGKTHAAEISSPTPSATQQPLVSQRITGFSRPSWGAGQYGSAEEKKSLADMLSATDPTCVGVVVTQYLAHVGSTHITRTVYTVPDADLVKEFQEIHAAGKCIFFSVHVDYSNDLGHWGADIGTGFNNADWRTFEDNYTQMILRYARLCQAHGCTLLSIGNEFTQFSQRSSYWTNLIPQIRAVYTGKLTYSAWGGGEQNKITWWNLVDDIGVNPWINVAPQGESDPPVTEIGTYWNSYIPTLVALVLTFRKPILFTEIGYDSYKGMSTHPWQEPTAKDTPDQNEQANAFLVMFKKMSAQPWFAGLFIWYWPVLPSAQSYPALDVSVGGKKAQQVIATWFAMLNTSYHTTLHHP